MATAGMTSSTTVSALLQKASQQYLECRRKVTAKADEVKALESEIQTLFLRITSLADGSHATKSVGRLELHIVAIQGVAPVEDAVVTVEIDPEYEEPQAAEEVAQAEETKEDPSDEESKDTEEETEEKTSEGEREAKEVKTEEEAKATTEETAAEEVEKKEEEADATTDEPAAEEVEKKEEEAEAEADEPAAEEVEKKEEEVTKQKPRRSVRWDDAESLPLDVVFDPVQSREAVVTIAIAKDGEEGEPVKEFRIPVSSLFQKNEINRWYVLKKVEHVHVDKFALTGVADEDEETKVKTEEPAKTEETETPAETPETAEEAGEKKTEVAETAPAETAEPAEPVASEEAEKKADEGEPVTEVPTEPHQTPVSAEATVESEDKVIVLQEGKLHVQVHFTMSEIEKLSQTAIALSQQKQEAEAVLAVLDREASSLRVKYERLNASQRSLSAGGVVKPRSTLLGGRGLGAGAVARVEKSTYQKVKDSVAAVLTPQRTQVLTSFAIFCGSVALFHFQGENLLA
jgi:hypothetical protein